MISFVCWKWRATQDNGRDFRSEHVNVLHASVARHYDRPHRFICITDDAAGLDPRIEAVPMPPQRFEHLQNPYQERYRTRRVRIGPNRYREVPTAIPRNKRFPSCYRRLWNFSEEARLILGDRIFALDIDVIVAGSLIPLVERTASFVGWCDPRFDWPKVAGGAYLLTAGAHKDVWEEFDPDRSPAIAKAAGLGGSDQAWMSYKLYPPRESWSSADGVVKINWLGQGITQVPTGTRLVFTGGHCPPWMPEVQRRYPWVKDHWRI